jgi:opacity protein-like surface antigen
MRTHPKTIGWLLGLVLLMWGLTDGVATAQARLLYRRPVRARVVHKFNYAPPRSQLLIEGALAMPLGNLEEDYFTTDRGLSQSNGYELGVRYRYFATPWLAVSPAFHYVRFGSDRGIADFPGYGDDLGYEFITSIYRYSIDLQSFIAGANAPLRPYVTIGVALAHHKYREEVTSYYPYEHGATGLAVAGGVGLAFGPVEVSALYNYDRFETTGLPSVTDDESWDWDHVSVRAGLSLGRF